jgi:hypothetical protein
VRTWTTCQKPWGHVRRSGERLRAVCALALLWLLPACGSADAPRVAVAPDAGDAGGGNDAGVGDCPDPNATGVHYQSKDIAQCPAPQDFSCATNQNGFYNACGCGCIDKGTSTCTVEPDPRLHFVSHDPKACVAQPPKCTVLQQAFDDACGCGCIDP